MPVKMSGQLLHGLRIISSFLIPGSILLPFS
jgi:hypothetical protein